MRGAITDKIQEIAKKFLSREITTTELRFYPYIQYVMMNEQKLDISKINQEERKILSVLKTEGHIEGGAGGMGITKEFWDYLSEILWEGYVYGGSLGEGEK